MPDLFSYAEQYPHVPGARAAATSKAGAEFIKPEVEALQETMLKFIRLSKTYGATNSECREYMDMRGRHVENGTCSARLSEMALKGEIKDSGQTRKGKSGVSQIVWVAV